MKGRRGTAERRRKRGEKENKRKREKREGNKVVDTVWVDGDDR